MVRSVLHIGAHRTGTSSLQKFLRDNLEKLQSSEIEVLCPPESRARSILDNVKRRVADGLEAPSSKMIISEENLLGTMRYNIATETLYPTAKGNLKKLSALYQPDVVMLSIRELGDYWTSSILFSLYRKEIPFPTHEALEAISRTPRTWVDVVKDIQVVFPSSKLIVREFTHLKDNPKRFFKVSTNWQDWNETRLNRRAQNMRPSADEVVSFLVDRSNFNALSRLGDTRDTQIFSQSQRDKMYETYQDDLEKLWKVLGPSLLENREHPKVTNKANSLLSSKTAVIDDHKTVFLHIGKTGGTFLKSLADADVKNPQSLYLGNHGDTLISTIKKFGKRRKLGFFFRNPESRFVSGFFSRMRQGRPEYDVNWTAAEAVAFSFFQTPNALAEALYSNDEHLKSAARFSMSSIFHLKHDYAHYLHSTDAIRYELEAGNVIMCCETDNIDKHLGKILGALGLLPSTPRDLRKSPAQETVAAEFSEVAKENIKKFCPREFEIYAACKTVAEQLGFSK